MSLIKLNKKAIFLTIISSLFLFNIFICPEKSYGLSVADLSQGNASPSKIESVKKFIENKKKATENKINELIRREKHEINKLQKNQQNLEKAKKALNVTEYKYKKAKSKLDLLQEDLDRAQHEYNRKEAEVSARIKYIYKGERISLLHMIFLSNDINTLLDRIYFQKRLNQQDMMALNEMHAKAQKLQNIKNNIESQKNNILYSLNRINTKKRVISRSINNSEYLINRLRTDRKTYEKAERELENQSKMISKLLINDYKGIKEEIKATGSFIKPIAGRISSPFGWRTHPIFKSKSFHSGIDIAGRNRSSIRASNSGKVVHSGWYGGYGKVVIVNHGNYKGASTSTLYAHLSRIAVRKGQKVKQGQVVGYEGTTGYSTGPHLHFEVRIKGNPRNPLKYIH